MGPSSLPVTRIAPHLPFCWVSLSPTPLPCAIMLYSLFTRPNTRGTYWIVMTSSFPGLTALPSLGLHRRINWKTTKLVLRKSTHISRKFQVKLCKTSSHGSFTNGGKHSRWRNLGLCFFQFSVVPVNPAERRQDNDSRAFLVNDTMRGYSHYFPLFSHGREQCQEYSNS